MSKYDTVSARIPHELKEKIKEYNIKISEVIRVAILAEVGRKQVEELEEQAAALKPLFERITTEDVVKAIRKGRETR